MDPPLDQFHAPFPHMNNGSPIGCRGSPIGINGSPIGMAPCLSFPIESHGSPIGCLGSPVGSHGRPIGSHGSPTGMAPCLSFPIGVMDHYGTALCLTFPTGSRGSPIGCHRSPTGSSGTPLGVTDPLQGAVGPHWANSVPRFPRTDDGIPIGSHGFPVGISGSHVGTAPRLSFPLWVTDHYGMAPSLGPPAGIASLRFSTVPQFPPWAAGSRDSTAPPLPLCGTAPSPGFPVAVRGPIAPLCASVSPRG